MPLRVVSSFPEHDNESEPLMGSGAPKPSGSLFVEGRYLAFVTGLLIGLYCGRHLIVARAQAQAEALPAELPPSPLASPPPPPPPPEPAPAAAAQAPRGAGGAAGEWLYGARWPTDWELTRQRILEAQNWMEKNKKRKPLQYKGATSPPYLYVGTGHVVGDLRGAPQPSNVSEVQCGHACEAHPKCQGFAWFKKATWSGTSECYLKGQCPSSRLRPIHGAHSWELQRRCGSNALFQAQQRANARG